MYYKIMCISQTNIQYTVIPTVLFILKPVFKDKTPLQVMIHVFTIEIENCL